MSSWPRAKSADCTYQIPDADAYWKMAPCASRVSVNDVEPPALLMTSEPPQLIATVFVPPWRTILMLMRVRSAGAVGRVSGAGLGGGRVDGDEVARRQRVGARLDGGRGELGGLRPTWDAVIPVSAVPLPQGAR